MMSYSAHTKIYVRHVVEQAVGLSIVLIFIESDKVFQCELENARDVTT